LETNFHHLYFRFAWSCLRWGVPDSVEYLFAVMNATQRTSLFNFEQNSFFD
jgi:hypothetical protein